MYVFDTDILIDYLRLHKPAIKLLDGLTKDERNIAFLTPFELLQGCGKKSQSMKVDTFLKNFKVLPVSAEISKKALALFREIKWRTHIDIPDAFVAATALVSGLTVVTRNLKHYRDIPKLKVERPY